MKLNTFLHRFCHFENLVLIRFSLQHKEREFVLKFSAMEIYNESVRDLLSTDTTPLRLLDDPEVNIFTNFPKNGDVYEIW